MRRLILLSLGLIGCFLLCTPELLRAQQSLFGIGPKAGFYLDGPVLMIGGVAEFPITRNWIFEPGLELVFERSSTTRIVGDGNVRYAFQVRGEDFSPYLLFGPSIVIDIASQGGETNIRPDFRANVGGGVTLNTRSDTQWWAGLKLFLLSEDDTDVGLQGGVIFYL